MTSPDSPRKPTVPAPAPLARPGPGEDRDSTPNTDKPKRQRLSAKDREQDIVREAVHYFAEVGFSGQTRELARRLGVTQGLLFRYFPTKDDLIERVYQEVFLGRWKVEWETTLKDRTIPLRTRITRFYLDYGRTIFNYEWIRIYMFAGLLGNDLVRRYNVRFRDRIVFTICHEMRHEYGLPEQDNADLDQTQLQVCWALNGAVALLAQREFAFDAPNPDLEKTITAIVASFFDGAPAAFKRRQQAGSNDMI